MTTAAYRERHREELRAKARAYREANPERVRESKRACRETHRAQIAEYMRQWRQDHRGERSERDHAYYEAHRGEKAARSRAWWQANPEKVAERNRRWRAANPDKVRVISRNAKLRRRQVSGSHTLKDIRHQFECQGGRCMYCAMLVGNDYHVDHIMPLARGGSNNPENIVIACPSCNMSKHDDTPLEWAEKMFESLIRQRGQ